MCSDTRFVACEALILEVLSRLNEFLAVQSIQSRFYFSFDFYFDKKLRAFITHGGLLSMYETVFHGVPAVVMPVFCDHDSNSEKAKADGYGKQHEMQ